MYVAELAKRYPGITCLSVHLGAVLADLIKTLGLMDKGFIYLLNLGEVMKSHLLPEKRCSIPDYGGLVLSQYLSEFAAKVHIADSPVYFVRLAMACWGYSDLEYSKERMLGLGMIDLSTHD